MGQNLKALAYCNLGAGLKQTMNPKTIVTVIVMLCFALGAVADDRELAGQRAKASALERQADWTLQFEDWGKLAVNCAPQTSGGVIAVQITKVKNLSEALSHRPPKQDLAVVIVSPRFFKRYSEKESDKHLEALAQKIKKAGFKRVVFLSDSDAGNLVVKE